MKNFLKRIDWRKFIKYELFALLIVGLLYLNSVGQGWNNFPYNFWVVFLVPGAFGVAMLLKSGIAYMEEKQKKI
jgi:hypothetical protein